MTPTLTSAMCPEPAHPHGVVGYTLADPGRTRNALRLARWALLALAIVAAAVVALALFSPLGGGGGCIADWRSWARSRNCLSVTDAFAFLVPPGRARRGVSGGRR